VRRTGFNLNRFYIPLAACAVVFFSCASAPNRYEFVDAGVENGDFDEALAALETGQAGKDPIYDDGDAILLYLDRGILAHYAGRYEDSAADLEAAEDLIAEAYTTSVSQGVASYILNDNTRDYAGEDYEDLYVNIFAALDYYHQGNVQGALVEIRKLTEKLDFLAVKYAEDAEKVEEYAQSQVQGVKMPAAPAVSNFFNSALARYLSAIFYRGIGSRDDARIDFVKLTEAWLAAPAVYSGPLPESLAISGDPGRETNEELTIPQGQARLNIVGFSGQSPIKVETEVFVLFPFLYVPDGELALPALQPRPSVINRVEVAVEGADSKVPVSFSLYTLENMGAVMESAFSQKYRVTLIKTFVRTTIKYLAAEIAGRAATERSGTTLAGVLAARVAKAAMDATESADTRSSRYFPALAWGGGINLEPGEYTVTVTFYAGSRVISAITREAVRVEAGKTNLVEAVSLR
jgi:hypothetical protein